MIAAPFIAFLTLTVLSEPADWQKAQVTEVWAPAVDKVEAKADAPPADATILFDGKTLSAWRHSGGKAASWDITDAAFTVKPGAGDIETAQAFCDVQLHLEWRTPTETNGPDGKPLEGQSRGNSGVFLQSRYEVQILDSYGSDTYANGQAGAIYKQTPPLKNASRAPGEWQTYDIAYTAPRFTPEGRLSAPGRITVLHNGVLIHNDTEIRGPTAWIGIPAYEAHGCAPLRLQDHGNRVSFRNIWARPL